MSHHGENSNNNTTRDSRKESEEKSREKKKKNSTFEGTFNTRGILKTSTTFVKMKNVEGVQFGDCFYNCNFPEPSFNKNPSDCASGTTFEEQSDNECPTAEETEETNDVIKKQDEKPDLSMLKIVDDVRNRRKNLYQEYTSWDKNTSENIKCLQKICNQMNDPFNSKCVVFSRFSTIGGSIIGMAGIVVIVPSDRLRLALIFGGTSLATIAGVSTFITNSYLSKQLCKNAKENFELNIENTKKVEESKCNYFQLLRQSKNELNQLKENDPEVQENLKDIFNDLDLNEMIQNSIFPSVSDMENMRPNEKILNQKMIMFEYTEKLITLIRNISINNIKGLMHKHLPKNLHKLIDIFLVLMQSPSVESRIDCIMMIIREIRTGSTETKINLPFSEIGKPMKISLFILNAAFLCWG